MRLSSRPGCTTARSNAMPGWADGAIARHQCLAKNLSVRCTLGAAQFRLHVHASSVERASNRGPGCSQMGGCGRVGLGATRAWSFLPTTREWTVLRHCTDARPGKLSRAPEASAMRECGGERLLLGDLPTLIITACASVSLPQPQRPLSRQALQGAVCLVPSPLARPSAVQTAHSPAVRGAMRVQFADGMAAWLHGCMDMAACPFFGEGQISSRCLIMFIIKGRRCQCKARWATEPCIPPS
jgi:hypothetical protein